MKNSIIDIMTRIVNVIIPADMKPHPKVHEETAAAILASHFGSDVYFIKTGSHGTPDVGEMVLE
jgi:hypothetical protein